MIKKETQERRAERLAKQRIRNKKRYYSMTSQERIEEYEYKRARFLALPEEERKRIMDHQREYLRQYRQRMKIN